MATKKEKVPSDRPSMDEIIDILVRKCRPVVKLYEDYSEKRKEEIQYYLKSLLYTALGNSLPDQYKVKINSEFMQVVQEILETAPLGD